MGVYEGLTPESRALVLPGSHWKSGARRIALHFGVYQDLSEMVKHVLSGPRTTYFVGYSAFSAASVPGIHTQRPRGVRA